MVLHVMDDGGVVKPAHTVAAVGAAVEANLNTLLAHSVNAVAVSEFTIRDLSSPTAPTAVLSSSAVGGLSSGIASANIAYLVHQATALGGRQYRGRNYQPGVPGSEITGDGSTIPSGLATAVSADWGSFITGVNSSLGSASIGLCIVSRVGTGPVTLCNSSTCETTLATQRRRVRK
jgi:ABC-type phosphate transport system substrate-binding protein